MRLREMNTANASRFIGLMEKHGFVVLTETGVIREAYLEFMRLLKAFFGGESDWKESCKGGVYFNERGIPMWHAGYERCGRVREAFRVPAAGLAIPSPSSPFPHQSWPCHRLRRAWLAVLRLLQRVCHRALTLTLGRPVLGAPPPPASDRRAAAAAGGEPGKQCPVCCSGMRVGEVSGEHGAAVDESMGRAGVWRGAGASGSGVRDSGGCGGGGYGKRIGVSYEERRPERVASDADDGRGPASGGGDGDGGGVDKGEETDADDDFSVSYALHYPNEFADPALEDEDLTVGEHVDPSLFVAEPCCGVEGLEIRDRSSGSWLPVEALCAGLGSNGTRNLADAEGREIILFGGKALERATGGRVRGAPHRVRRGDLGRRYCFIYEQKYAEFFPPPAID
eukprot:g16554.t1